VRTKWGDPPGGWPGGRAGSYWC